MLSKYLLKEQSRGRDPVTQKAASEQGPARNGVGGLQDVGRTGDIWGLSLRLFGDSLCLLSTLTEAPSFGAVLSSSGGHLLGLGAQPRCLSR